MRILRAIIFILICIGLIWLAIILITRAFGGGGGSEPEAPVATTQLSDLANSDAVTTMYIDGPIVANQEHVGIRISVDRNAAKIERITGYGDTVVDQRTYPNTAASYNAFLSALESLNFTAGTNDTELQNADGTCPFGNRYIYTVSEGGSNEYSYWTTSCGGGTYGGQRNNTRTLFLNQIPRQDRYEVTKNFAV